MNRGWLLGVVVALGMAGARAQIDEDLVSGFDRDAVRRGAPVHYVGEFAFRCGAYNYDEHVVGQLAGLGSDAVPALLRELESAPHGAQDGSSAALAQMGGPALDCLRAMVFPPYRCNLPDPRDPGRAREVEELLGELTDYPQPASALISTRSWAVDALYEMSFDAGPPGEEALALIGELVWDVEVDVRNRAIDRLGLSKRARERDLLAELVLRDPTVRLAAVKALAEGFDEAERSEAQASAVLFACADPDVEVRRRAFGLLRFLEDPGLVAGSVIAAGVFDGDPYVRLEAVQVVATTSRFTDAWPMLSPLLVEKDPAFRYVGLLSLTVGLLPPGGEGPSKEDVAVAVPAVLGLLPDQDDRVVARAVDLLARLSWFDDGLCTRAFRDAPGKRRREVLRQAVEHGPSGEARLELFRAAIVDPDPDLRAGAVWALRKEPITPTISALFESADADEGLIDAWQSESDVDPDL